jgi:hypothetical protein
MFDIFLKTWQKWQAKEEFYKLKVVKSLKELDEIFVRMQTNQSEIERLKKETKMTLFRIEKHFKIFDENRK